MVSACSANHSAVQAHFSTSASASRMGFPISAVRSVASRGFSWRSVAASSANREAREPADVSAQDSRAAQARSSARSTCCQVCSSKRASSAPVAGVTDKIAISRPLPHGHHRTPGGACGKPQVVCKARHAMRRLLAHYMLPQWPRVALLALLSFAGIGLDVLNPQVIRRFVDGALAGDALPALLRLGGIYLAVAASSELLWIGESY